MLATQDCGFANSLFSLCHGTGEVCTLPGIDHLPLSSARGLLFCMGKERDENTAWSCMDVVQSCLVFHTFLSCFCKTRNTTACLQGTETEVQNLAVERGKRFFFFFPPLIYFAPSLDSAGSPSSKINA